VTQRLFPEALSPWEGVLSLLLWHASAEPAQGKQTASPLAAQTQALPGRSTQDAHWEQTNLVAHLPCSQKATAAAGSMHPLCDAAWAWARGKAQGCAFFLRDFESFQH